MRQDKFIVDISKCNSFQRHIFHELIHRLILVGQNLLDPDLSLYPPLKHTEISCGYPALHYNLPCQPLLWYTTLSHYPCALQRRIEISLKCLFTLLQSLLLSPTILLTFVPLPHVHIVQLPRWRSRQRVSLII